MTRSINHSVGGRAASRALMGVDFLARKRRDGKSGVCVCAGVGAGVCAGNALDTIRSLGENAAGDGVFGRRRTLKTLWAGRAERRD